MIVPIFALVGLAFDQIQINRFRQSLQSVAEEAAAMTASLDAQLPEESRRQQGFAHLRKAMGTARIPLSDAGVKIDFKTEGETPSSTVTLEAPPHLSFNILRRAPALVRVRGSGIDRTAAIARLAIACHAIESMKEDERDQCRMMWQ